MAQSTTELFGCRNVRDRPIHGRTRWDLGLFSPSIQYQAPSAYSGLRSLADFESRVAVMHERPPDEKGAIADTAI